MEKFKSINGPDHTMIWTVKHTNKLYLPSITPGAFVRIYRDDKDDLTCPYLFSMSFFDLERDFIKVGDFSPEDLAVIKIESDGFLQNRLGRFKHVDMIGKPFGSQVWSHDGAKHLHVLRPTPELWTRALPHRTQIIYMPDVSFLLEQMEVKAGSIVIESGTGSGSFSHSIARAIGETGHLYTFDFHEPRVEQATKEFAEHGLSNFVTVACRDVCNTGFGLENMANAVFLDLPSPWTAIEYAKAALKKDQVTRIACFSPCMEQVQKTLPVLIKNGFCELEMFEVIVRSLDVEKIDIIASNTSQLAVKDKKTPIINGEEETISRKRPLADKNGSSDNIATTIYSAKYKSDSKGHTSYLYFATLLPSVSSLSSSSSI